MLIIHYYIKMNNYPLLKISYNILGGILEMFKKFVYSVLAVLIVSILLVPIGVLAHTAANPFVTDLIAGQNIDAGSVSVWNDDTTLYVKFQGEDGWLITETHVAVEVDLEDIPTNGAENPKIGKFEFASEHQPGVESYTHEIPLDWPVGTFVFIAAHAVVWSADQGEETAWGCYEGTGGGEWEGKRWGCYFDYEIQDDEPWKLLNIPGGMVKITPVYGDNYGEPAFFDTTVSECPEGYDVTNGVYDGWCVDSRIGIENRETYDVTLYLSTDPNLPWYAKDDEQWDYVNYILNKDYSYLGATIHDIQNAIWYFTDSDPKIGAFPTSDYSPEILEAIIKDVEGNGVGFILG
jgi:hypothetical protein